jgi:phosphate transport system substrate-binding protein
MGYATSGVKMLAISRKAGEPGVAPSVDNARSGAYPITRPLLLYTLGQPEGATRGYLDWILSAEGQECVRRAGYVPLGSGHR